MTVATLLTLTALAASPDPTAPGAGPGGQPWATTTVAFSSWAEPLCDGLLAPAKPPKPVLDAEAPQCDDPLDDDPRCHLGQPVNVPCGGCSTASLSLRAHLIGLPELQPLDASTVAQWPEEDRTRDGFPRGLLRPPR